MTEPLSKCDRIILVYIVYLSLPAVPARRHPSAADVMGCPDSPNTKVKYICTLDAIEAISDRSNGTRAS